MDNEAWILLLGFFLRMVLNELEAGRHLIFQVKDSLIEFFVKRLDVVVQCLNVCFRGLKAVAFTLGHTYSTSAYFILTMRLTAQ